MKTAQRFFRRGLWSLGVALATAATSWAAQRVDVLVVYTPAARAYAGSANAMKAAINTYIAATNTAYSNSDIDVVMKLVVAREVNYTESGSFSTDLSRLKSSGDAFLQPVPGWRDTYRADLVALVRRNDAGGVAGIAYLGNLTSSFAASAYSVSADIWAVSNLTFPHETGHNFGCAHDHDNSSSAPRVYAYGHRFDGTNNVQYRTIMAYAPGSRISYFSNPSISYQGTATGVAGSGNTAADNARLLEESSVVAEAFRSLSWRLNASITADLDNDGHSDLLITDNATGERYFERLSGVSRVSTTVFATVGAGWRLAAAGDLNGDGQADLIFQNPDNGAHTLWLMQGTNRSSGASLPTLDASWRLVGATDFDADGKDDLVYENTSTGARIVRHMNGTNYVSTSNLPTVGVGWTIGAVEDFDGDGHPDLVFENPANGNRTLWLMNGVARSQAVALPTVGLGWRLAGAGDFNGDGKADLVSENPGNGKRVVWYMDGSTHIGGAWLPGPGVN